MTEHIFTAADIEAAAQRQPDRYILYRDKDGKLVEVAELDHGYTLVPLPDGTWIGTV